MKQAIRVMIADYKILLDACVMANYGVCDLYLRLAEKPRLFLPKWSQDILDEVYSTHIEKLGWDERLANSFQNTVKDAFPEAMITDYQELIPIMTNDEKDRHVLAAGVREKLNLIITFNLKDFKAEDLSKWNIETLHPQDYLLTLYSMKPGIVMMKLAKIAQKKEQDLEDMGEDTTY
jgi:predicted nucleic acid-binding protein